MKAMTAKEFDTIQPRDLENGAIRDSIRMALEERETQKTVTRTEIENAIGDTNDEQVEWVAELFREKGFTVRMGK